MVVVAFTDIVGCIGGSRGSDPCKDTMGARVAARALSRGLGSAKSSLFCSVTSGPQVVWCWSDSDSDIAGVGAWCSVRLVTCT